MRQVVNTGDGGHEVLRIEETPDPKPGPEEMVIRVKAAGLNFADILARKGLYPDAPSKPCVMGYEVAGIVESVGEQVQPSWKGRQVIATTRFGGQAERVVVQPFQVFEKPDMLSFEEAAALPVNYLTAWVLLVVMGSLGSDESILIHNAGGGVGLAVLQLAKHIGATTYGTASKHKHPFLYERGLDYAIDYRNKDWYDEVMRLTDNKGIDLITDPLGGSEWKRSYKALRSTGRLGMFGVSTASSKSGGKLKNRWNLLKTVLKMPFFHPLPLLNKNKGVFGVNIGHLWHESEKVHYWIGELLQGVTEGWLRPYVDTTFALEDTALAHRYIEDRKNTGKVILTVK